MASAPTRSGPLDYTPDAHGSKGNGPNGSATNGSTRDGRGSSDLGPAEQRGVTTVPAAVVGKIAQQAATEVAHIGGSAGGVLGLGARRDFDSRPDARCELYGTVAVISLDAGIAFPVPLEDTCQGLRQHVRDRVESLTGLQVGRMDIEVSWLHPGRRSRGVLR